MSSIANKAGSRDRATSKARHPDWHTQKHRETIRLEATPMTTHYIALIHKDADSDYGVSFPDLPGVVTAGTDLDDARRMAEEALQFHIEGMIEDGDAVPEPSTLEQVMRRSGKSLRGRDPCQRQDGHAEDGASERHAAGRCSRQDRRLRRGARLHAIGFPCAGSQGGYGQKRSLSAQPSLRAQPTRFCSF